MTMFNKCPHCGYCPHCGRSDPDPHFVRPSYPVWPWYTPNPAYPITWGDTPGTVTTGGSTSKPIKGSGDWWR